MSLYGISFMSFFISQNTSLYAISLALFGIFFMLNKKFDNPKLNAHLEYLLTLLLLFSVASVITGGFAFYIMMIYFIYKFWIGVHKAYQDEIIAFEYF